jgi:hypothetical protein
MRCSSVPSLAQIATLAAGKADGRAAARADARAGGRAGGAPSKSVSRVSALRLGR